MQLEIFFDNGNKIKVDEDKTRLGTECNYHTFNFVEDDRLFVNLSHVCMIRKCGEPKGDEDE